MSIAKSKMKVAVVNDIGNQLDDMRESASDKMQQSIGAKTAAEQIWNNVRKISKSVGDDLDKGVIEKAISDGPLAVVKLIKEYIGRTAGSCEVTIEHFKNQETLAQGKVQAFSEAVKVLEKMKKQEEMKVMKVLAAVESGQAKLDGDDVVMVSDGPRPPGVGPGPNIKQQRLAKEGTAKVISIKDNPKQTRLDKLLSKKDNGKPPI